eukprot:4032057-Pleurochrysis_carterae.AAC.1
MARPADGDEAFASLIKSWISTRPLFWHCERYAGRVAGDPIVPRMVSMSCLSTFASVSGEITKRSRSSALRGRTAETGAAEGG